MKKLYPKTPLGPTVTVVLHILVFLITISFTVGTLFVTIYRSGLFAFKTSRCRSDSSPANLIVYRDQHKFVCVDGCCYWNAIILHGVHRMRGVDSLFTQISFFFVGVKYSEF